MVDITKGIEKLGKGILKGAFDPVAKGVKIGVAGLVLVGGVYAGTKAVKAYNSWKEGKDNDGNGNGGGNKKSGSGKQYPWDPKRK